ncbi:MAG: DUF5663 domain-containing protein [Candidatus Paceibacteria bacterium]
MTPEQSLIQELGLDHLSHSDQEEILQSMYSAINARIVERAHAQLSQETQKRLEEELQAQNQSKVQTLLQEHVSNLDAIVTEETNIVKETLKQNIQTYKKEGLEDLKHKLAA